MAWVKRVGGVVLTLLLSGMARADILTNSLKLVIYQAKECYHLTGDIPHGGQFEFVIDCCGDGVYVNDHGSSADVCFAKTDRGHWVSYLDFDQQRPTTNLGLGTNLYCAITWNRQQVKHTTADYNGWFHLRFIDGVVELVSSGIETQEGERCKVEPDGWPLLIDVDVPPESEWLDPSTGLTWRYTNYGTYCGIGTGVFEKPAVASGEIPKVLMIPDTIAGLPVKRIEKYAFSRRVHEYRVSVPSSVVEIAECAFMFSTVDQINVAEGNSAFASLNGFVVSSDGKELVVVPPVLYIPDGAIPEGISVVGPSAFAGYDDGTLRMPVSLKAIRSKAFIGSYISTIEFEGDEPELADDALDGGHYKFDVRARLGTKGWPNGMQWHEHDFAPLDAEWYDVRKIENERVAEDGSRWIDTIEIDHKILKGSYKSGGLWYREDQEHCLSNLTTRQVSPVASEEPILTGYRMVETLTRYADLERVEQRVERTETTDYNGDLKCGVFGEKAWNYDCAGRLQYAKNTVRYEADAVTKTGIIETRESRTLIYEDDRLAQESICKDIDYADGMTESEERTLYYAYDSDGHLTERLEYFFVSLDEVVRRREKHVVKYKYDTDTVIEIVRENEVRENGVCIWDEQQEVYDKDGKFNYARAKSGRMPEGTSTPETSTKLYPGECVQVNGKEEIDALARVAFVAESPTGLTGESLVHSSDYLGYFKPTAKRIGEELWEVGYEIDPEAIQLAESVNGLGTQLGDIASGTMERVTLPSKPGLYYGIAYAESPAGPYENAGFTLATGETVEVAPPPQRANLFLRVVVRAEKEGSGE